MGLGVGQSSCHHRTEVAWLRLVFPAAAVLGLLIGEHLRANSCASWINTGDRGRGREGKEVKREKLRMLKREREGNSGGSRGVPWVPRNPLFVVLRACVAGLVRVHERSRQRSGQRNPHFRHRGKEGKREKGTYAAERKRRERARR